MMATTSHAKSDIPPVVERMLPPIADVDITEIYCPAQSSTIAADIVFVHGLMGHPKNTWLCGKEPKAQASVVFGESAQKRSIWKKLSGRDKVGGKSYDKSVEGTQYCFWPYDLLPKDDIISNARILLYGYDSHPTHFYTGGTNRMTITQHAENLMHNVAGVREQCRGRPIIFIAHSLGGILVKGALNESRQMSQPQYSDLFSSCQAIVFMGTPHSGAEIATWGRLTSNVVGALPGGFTTYSKVLQGLEPDSDTLYNISRRFNEILNQAIPARDKIQICSIQEGLGMSSVKGAGKKVVPDYSSKFNRTDIEQSFFNQTANHMTMCKFSSAENQTYKNVLRVLQGYLRAIEEKHADVQRALDTNTQIKVSELVKKLDFDGRLAREHQLNNLITNEHSFDWVWESEFVKWLKCDAKVFWIAGKPASGKSTLVNHITNHNRTREVVKEALGGGLVIAKFFFDFRAKNDLRNNFEGLRRSLLYQLLGTSRALAADVVQHFGVNRLDDQIMLANATIFEYALNKNDRPTLFFIDGLDEYEGCKPELLSLIDKVTGFKVKICLSSRYEKPFTTTFNNLRFQFRMDVLNRPGIYAYAKHILETTLRPSNDEERSALDSASEDIAQFSSGVFLWARFAVSDVIDLLCEGHQIEYGWVRTIIHSMPPELGDVYARMFQLMRDKDKKTVGIIFALISSAPRDLMLFELFEATLLAGNDFRSLDDNITRKDLNDFQRYLEAIGAGLISCVDPDYGGPHKCVRLIHRSVRTYLDSTGWKQLFGEQGVPESHHTLWLDICHNFLAGRRVKWVAPVDPDAHVRRKTLRPTDQELLARFTVGLREYVHTFLPYHAYHYEQETATSSWPLIHQVLDPQFVREHCRIHFQFSSRLYCNECDLIIRNCAHVRVLCNDVQLAVSHRLSLYVEEALRHHPEAFKSDSFASAIVFADAKLENSEDLVCDTPSKAHREGQISSGEQIKPPLDSPIASPLATAVIWSFYLPSSELSKFVLLLAPISSRLKDVDMLMAIRTLSSLEIQALLTQFPQRPLRLYSRVANHQIKHVSWWDREHMQLAVENLYGPLWEVGRRDDIGSLAEILRLFLNRGEEMNSRCGPKGTILHSVAEDQLLFTETPWPTEQLEALLGTLISHGADIHAKGPEGNVLEYVWREAHRKALRYRAVRERTFSALVRSLIKMGATNSVCDPNGFVPSKARLLAVAEADEPTREDICYYFHGMCSNIQAENYRRGLDGLSLLSPPPKRRSTY